MSNGEKEQISFHREMLQLPSGMTEIEHTKWVIAEHEKFLERNPGADIKESMDYLKKRLKYLEECESLNAEFISKIRGCDK